MRLRTLRLCLSFPLCSTLDLISLYTACIPGSDREMMIVTADGLYYSRYIKHFLGGRGEWVGEIYERDDVAHEGVASVPFLRSEKGWEGGEEGYGTRHWGDTLIQSIYYRVRQWLVSEDNVRFWSRWMCAFYLLTVGNGFLVKITCNCFI